MTDLQINTELAKAMGWGKLNDLKWDNEVFCWNGNYWRGFSYLDPVIFVAICKHWNLRINHKYDWVGSDACTYTSKNISIEKAAALCVIDTVKLGIK